MKRFIALCWLLLSVISTPCVFAQQKQKPSPQPQAIPAAMTNQDADKPLTNADIVRLSKAGLTDAVIIKVIGASKQKFNLTVNGLIALKNSGVSQTVIEAMLLSSAAAPSTNQTPAPSQLSAQQPSPALPPMSPPMPSSSATTCPPLDAPSNSTTPQQSQQPQQPQPCAVLLEGNNRRVLIPSPPQIVQTKAKGGDLASIAKDEAVTGALSQVATEAAVRTGVAMGASAASLPLVGAILGGGMMLGGMLRKKPQITYVTALGGQTSAVVVNQKGNAPKFEITYGNIAGVNPDEFEPALVRLTATANNWRLVYARRARADNPLMEGKFYNDFTEERVPVKTTKIERGRFQVEPETALPAGEYAVVLRPVSQEKTFSVKNAGDAAAFTLTQMVWDFTVK